MRRWCRGCGTMVDIPAGETTHTVDDVCHNIHTGDACTGISSRRTPIPLGPVPMDS